jgi:hypothetical protein
MSFHKIKMLFQASVIIIIISVKRGFTYAVFDGHFLYPARPSINMIKQS